MYLKTFIVFIIILVFTWVNPAYSRREDSTLSKITAPGDSDFILAKLSFDSYLKCRPMGKEKSLSVFLKCIKPYFVSGLPDDILNQYAKAIVFPTEYSKLYPCKEKMTKIIRTFEQKNYDLFLCFESNLTAPNTHTGVVFFKKEHGQLKILRLKL